MKANFLKIEKVRIEKTKKGLIFYLPSNFDGNALKALKEKYKKQLDEFRSA